MDSTIIGAVIQGVATLIAVGLTAWIMRPKVNDAEHKPTITESRSIFLTVGFWLLLLLSSLGGLVYELISDSPMTKSSVLLMIINYVTLYVGIISGVVLIKTR